MVGRGVRALGSSSGSIPPRKPPPPPSRRFPPLGRAPDHRLFTWPCPRGWALFPPSTPPGREPALGECSALGCDGACGPGGYLGDPTAVIPFLTAARRGPGAAESSPPMGVPMRSISRQTRPRVRAPLCVRAPLGPYRTAEARLELYCFDPRWLENATSRGPVGPRRRGAGGGAGSGLANRDVAPLNQDLRRGRRPRVLRLASIDRNPGAAPRIPRENRALTRVGSRTGGCVSHLARFRPRTGAVREKALGRDKSSFSARTTPWRTPTGGLRELAGLRG